MSEVIVRFHEHEQIADDLLLFAVVMARHKNKWVFCRHKERYTYEIPGGHKEHNEDIDHAAKRELIEETGAIKFELLPICVYSVTTGISNASYGKLYYAEISEIGTLLPESEIAEIFHFDILPGNLTYPLIQPFLYEKTQMWLNLNSAKDEVWDVYDAERNFKGRTHRRADPLLPGDYHLVVHVWLKNSKGEFLITKRAPNKGYPNMWECTGGSALAGDNSITAAIREVKEETGLEAYPENGRCLFTMTRDNDICDVWLFNQDFDVRNIVLQENETIDAKYVKTIELRQMINEGEFIAFHYIEDLLAVAT